VQLSNPSPVDEHWRLVSTGIDFTCAIRLDFTVQCWGANEMFTSWATELGTDMYIHIDIGVNYACAITMDGDMVCWGAALTGVTIPAGPYISVSAYADGACGIRDSGQLVCWGMLWAHYEADVLTMSYEYSTSTLYDSVTVADKWFCARKLDTRTLWCRGAIVPRIFPTYSSVYSGEVLEFASNPFALCLITKDEELKCFGGGLDGAYVQQQFDLQDAGDKNVQYA
jgi:hypothetical protein